jgi:3-keto-disaccharide hydrolase
MNLRKMGSPIMSRRRFFKACSATAGIVWAHFGAVGAEAAAPRRAKRDAITPSEGVINLFNGRDLAGFYPWLQDNKYDDPKKVFTVKDGLLRISGEVAGYIATEREYRDYHLIAEYKWGELTYGSKTVRNSGILLHGTGPDGNRSPWMASIECQIAQGCVGDFIVIRGKDANGSTIPVTITSETIVGTDGRTRWKKGGKPTVYSGKQFWWSLHEAGFKELLDTRGKDDVESPLGEWTRVECICAGNRITVVINGTTVNECFDVFPSTGKILLESEGFEILFRKIELHPLKKSSAAIEPTNKL